MQFGPETGTYPFGPDTVRPLILEVSAGTMEGYRETHPEADVVTSQEVSINGYSVLGESTNYGEMAYIT